MDFFKEFSSDDITNLACGRKHYVILNKNNQLLVWGSVFKEKA
jgi:alpha-tubulin suppressor-like RCC1 family protein